MVHLKQSSCQIVLFVKKTFNIEDKSAWISLFDNPESLMRRIKKF